MKPLTLTVDMSRPALYQLTLDDQGRVTGWVYTGRLVVGLKPDRAAMRVKDEAQPWWKRITG